MSIRLNSKFYFGLVLQAVSVGLYYYLPDVPTWKTVAVVLPQLGAIWHYLGGIEYGETLNIRPATFVLTKILETMRENTTKFMSLETQELLDHTMKILNEDLSESRFFVVGDCKVTDKRTNTTIVFKVEVVDE